MALRCTGLIRIEIMELTLTESNWLSMTKPERRNALMEFEQACKAQEPEHGIHIEPTHVHCEGVYAREIVIPAGASLVGEIHLHDQINVISQGKIRVATEEGLRDIEAPCTFISPAGTKRAGFAVTETVWTVFHATTSTDPQEIKKEFIAPDYETLDNKLENQHVLGSNSSDSGIDSLHSTREQKSKEGST